MPNLGFFDLNIRLLLIEKYLKNLNFSSTSIKFLGPNQLLGSGSTHNADGTYNTTAALLKNEQIPDQEIEIIKIVGLEELLDALSGRLDIVEDYFPVTITYNDIDVAGDTWTTVTKVLDNIGTAYTFLFDVLPRINKAVKTVSDLLGLTGGNRKYVELIDEVDDVVNDVAKNVEDIATQTANNAALQTRVATVETQTGALQTRTAAVETQTTALQTRTAAVEAVNTTQTASIATNTTGLAANDAHDIVQDGLISSAAATATGAAGAAAAASGIASGAASTAASAAAGVAALSALMVVLGFFKLGSGGGYEPADDPPDYSGDISTLKSNVSNLQSGLSSTNTNVGNLQSGLASTNSAVGAIQTFNNVVGTALNTIGVVIKNFTNGSVAPVSGLPALTYSNLISYLVSTGILLNTSGVYSVNPNFYTAVDILSKTVATITPSNVVVANGDSLQTIINKFQGQISNISVGTGATRSILQGFTSNYTLNNNEYIKFSSVYYSQGANITLNTSTTFNINLKANKVYKLNCNLNGFNFLNSSDFLVAQWFNKDSVTAIGTTTICLPVTYGGIYSGSSEVVTYYSPTVDTNVGVKIIISGNASPTVQINPGPVSFTVEEVGAYTVSVGSTLNTGNIVIGDASNMVKQVVPSGDWTIDTNGLATLSTPNLLAKTVTTINPTDGSTPFLAGESLQSIVNKTQGQISLSKTSITQLQNTEKALASVMNNSGLATPSYDGNGNVTNYGISGAAINIANKVNSGIGYSFQGASLTIAPPYLPNLIGYWTSQSLQNICFKGTTNSNGTYTGTNQGANIIEWAPLVQEGKVGNLSCNSTQAYNALPFLLVNDTGVPAGNGNSAGVEIFTGNSGFFLTTYDFSSYGYALCYTVSMLFRPYYATSTNGATARYIFGADSGNGGVSLQSDQYGLFTNSGTTAKYYLQKGAVTTGTPNSILTLNQYKYYHVIMSYGPSSTYTQNYTYAGTSAGSATPSVSTTGSAGVAFQAAWWVNGVSYNGSLASNPGNNIANIFSVGCSPNNTSTMNNATSLIAVSDFAIHHGQMSAGQITNMYSYITTKYPGITFATV